MSNNIVNKDVINICSKHDILLQKNKINNNFLIEFFIQNHDVNLFNFIKFSLYELIGELNQDILERIEIINLAEDDSTCDILFLFKSLSKELGISKKYMFIKNTKTIENNLITFKSYDLDARNLNFNLNGYEKITCNSATLNVLFLTPNAAKVQYTFSMETGDELPIYMENMTGILMKKLFYKLKSFIEMIK